MTRRVRLRRGRILSDQGRHALAAALLALLALAAAFAAFDPAPEGEGDPLPPATERNR